MAKGIVGIKNNPSGGSLLIIDPATTAGDGAGGTTDTGTTTTPGAVSGTPGTVDNGALIAGAGESVNFTEAYAGNVGDIVDFQLDANGATGLATVSAGTVLTGPQNGKINVGANQSALIKGANVDGKISLSGGGTIVISDKTSLEGKIEASGASTLIICAGVTIEGKIQTTGLKMFVLKGSTTEGKVISTGDTYVSISGNTIKGDLEVANAATCNIPAGSNNVSGKTTLGANCK
jgi:hypothetical protein